MKWLSYLNLLSLASIALTVASIFGLMCKKSEVFERQEITPLKQFPAPPRATVQLSERLLDQSLFHLAWSPPKMLLPDLRREITYYGTIERPDIPPNSPLMHIALRGQQEVIAVQTGKPLYLSYESLSASHHSNASYGSKPTLWGDVGQRGNYLLSMNNEPTPLWIELTPNKASRSGQVTVHMTGEMGERIEYPLDYRNFTLPEQEMSKRSFGWELGSFRVDSTLLIRQKARWLGSDRFLEMHGGEDFAFSLFKERLDFQVHGEPYSCFVKVGDWMIWKDQRWHVVDERESTLGHPLLVVKKVEEKLMAFDLWDAQGKSKTTLSLIRSKDLTGFPSIEDEFKFIGAKTWAKFIVECRSGRLTLKPCDWLVLIEDKWLKLDTPQMVDAFVNQEISGPLLVLDKLGKQNGKQVLMGHLFNASRTETEYVALPTSSPSPYLTEQDTVPHILKFGHHDFQGDEL